MTDLPLDGSWPWEGPLPYPEDRPLPEGFATYAEAQAAHDSLPPLWDRLRPADKRAFVEWVEEPWPWSAATCAELADALADLGRGRRFRR